MLATVKRVKSRRTRQGRTIVEVDVFDGTSYLHVVFFNQGWRAKQLRRGTQAVFFGKLERFRDRRQMTNPVVDLVGDRTGRIVPIYPQSEKAGGSTRGSWPRSSRRRWPGPGPSPTPCPRAGATGSTWSTGAPPSPPSTTPSRWRRPRPPAAGWCSTSCCACSWPWSCASGPSSGRPRASATWSRASCSCPGSTPALPFALTGAQRRAIDEIAADLAGPHPMHRLLQGDVGSGKTLVALTALLMAVQGGYQGAFMAPTEVLAEQHDVEPAPPARRPDRARRAHPHRRPAAAGRAADQPHDGRRAGPDPGRAGRGPRRPARRHPRPAGGAGRVPGPGRDRDRRAAPLRRRAAGRPAGQGRRPRRAGDDGHAHPPHRGHDRLRRPRRHHPRRAAARAARR